MTVSSRSRQHGVDGAAESPPRRGLLSELLSSEGRELVESRAPIVLRRSPGGGEPPALHEAVERGIERSLVHLKDAARDLLDALADPPPMHGLERSGLENEQVKRTLQ